MIGHDSQIIIGHVADVRPLRALDRVAHHQADRAFLPGLVAPGAEVRPQGVEAAPGDAERLGELGEDQANRINDDGFLVDAINHFGSLADERHAERRDEDQFVVAGILGAGTNLHPFLNRLHGLRPKRASAGNSRFHSREVDHGRLVVDMARTKPSDVGISESAVDRQQDHRTQRPSGVVEQSVDLVGGEQSFAVGFLPFEGFAALGGFWTNGKLRAVPGGLVYEPTVVSPLEHSPDDRDVTIERERAEFAHALGVAGEIVWRETGGTSVAADIFGEVRGDLLTVFEGAERDGMFGHAGVLPRHVFVHQTLHVDRPRLAAGFRSEPGRALEVLVTLVRALRIVPRPEVFVLSANLLCPRSAGMSEQREVLPGLIGLGAGVRHGCGFYLATPEKKQKDVEPPRIQDRLADMDNGIRNTCNAPPPDAAKLNSDSVNPNDSAASQAPSDNQSNRLTDTESVGRPGVDAGVEIPAGPRPGDGPIYHVNRKTQCWVWQRFLNEDGYGVFKRNRKPIFAHRHYYQKHRGPIPVGLELDHLCRNRACVNPAHLEPVTSLVNCHRGARCKINAAIVREIRTAIAAGEKHRDIAPRFGISSALVHHIATDRVWTIPSAYPETSGAGFEPATIGLEDRSAIQLRHPDPDNQIVSSAMGGAK